MTSPSSFDFGDGPVPAHQHPNGGGWIAETAYAAETAQVYGDARVSGNAHVYGNAQVGRHTDLVVCGPLGSRNAYLTLYRCADGSIGASTGCFAGSLDELLVRVERDHPHGGAGDHYRALVPVLAAYLDQRIAEPR